MVKLVRDMEELRRPEPAAEVLNDELLQPEAEEKHSKRNSKDDLIRKILRICEEKDIELEESDSKLRRMTKPQLLALLAEKIETAMQNSMAEQVGVKPGSNASLIGLGALRMVHNIAAGSCEKVANIFLKPRGYEIVGFQKSLTEPHVAESIDQVLIEISQETDVLQYFESPYCRLALCWGSALISSVQRRPISNIEPKGKHAAYVESRTTPVQAPLQYSFDRGPQNGQKLRDSGPAEEAIKSV